MRDAERRKVMAETMEHDGEGNGGGQRGREGRQRLGRDRQEGELAWRVGCRGGEELVQGRKRVSLEEEFLRGGDAAAETEGRSACAEMRRRVKKSSRARQAVVEADLGLLELLLATIALGRRAGPLHPHGRRKAIGQSDVRKPPSIRIDRDGGPLKPGEHELLSQQPSEDRTRGRGMMDGRRDRLALG